MIRYLFLLLYSIVSLAVPAQVAYNYPKAITNMAKKNLDAWMQKGKYESTDDYLLRLQREKDSKSTRFVAEATEYYKDIFKKQLNYDSYWVSEYDADNQSYKMYIDEDRKVNTVFVLPVKKEYAPDFDSQVEMRNVEFRNDDFILENNNWVLSYVEVYVEIGSSSMKFIYDIKNPHIYTPPYKPSITVTDRDIIIGGRPDVIKTDKNIDPKFNVEQTPISTVVEHNPNALALIIGNNIYKEVPPVAYAEQDANLIKKYAIEVLGIEEANITMLINANATDFNTVLGNNDAGTFFGQIISSSDVYIFYIGHGATDKDGEPCLMPVDAPKETGLVANNGFAVQKLIDFLRKKEANSKTIILDACFANKQFVNSVSGVIVPPKANSFNDAKMMFIGASNGYATWYQAKHHSLLTYFLCKAVHDTQRSDSDGDGVITYQELENYITHTEYGVPYYSIRLNNLEQTPIVKGEGKDRIFCKYKK